jgi:hypothetical protein
VTCAYKAQTLRDTDTISKLLEQVTVVASAVTSARADAGEVP